MSTTIDKYAYASLRFRNDSLITVNSLDYDIVARYRLDEPLIYDGKLDLIKAAIKNLNGRNHDQGLDFFLHNDAPPGSGLGSSSAMVVALIGTFKRWEHLELTNYEVADLAWQIERVDLGIKGGRQDQYSATFGGFNFIEFYRDLVVVNPLRIDSEVLNELHYNLVLCYTGRTRVSGRIIETQVEGYVQQKADVIAAMEELKQIATDLKRALLQGRLGDFGCLLNDAWLSKKRTASQITDPHIDELYETAIQHGALGGKITGAGGGGYMFFYCTFDKKHILAEQLEKLGAKVVNFNFDTGGLQTWEIR
ncbi:MAG TPA: GHMP kinase [Anaerolineae bacterium]